MFDRDLQRNGLQSFLLHLLEHIYLAYLELILRLFHLFLLKPLLPGAVLLDLTRYAYIGVRNQHRSMLLVALAEENHLIASAVVLYYVAAEGIALLRGAFLGRGDDAAEVQRTIL